MLYVASFRMRSPIIMVLLVQIRDVGELDFAIDVEDAVVGHQLVKNAIVPAHRRRCWPQVCSVPPFAVNVVCWILCLKGRGRCGMLEPGSRRRHRSNVVLAVPLARWKSCLGP